MWLVTVTWLLYDIRKLLLNTVCTYSMWRLTLSWEFHRCVIPPEPVLVTGSSSIYQQDNVRNLILKQSVNRAWKIAFQHSMYTEKIKWVWTTGLPAVQICLLLKVWPDGERAEDYYDYYDNYFLILVKKNKNKRSLEK